MCFNIPLYDYYSVIALMLNNHTSINNTYMYLGTM